MIIKINDLTNFKKNHGRNAEIAVMVSVCFLYDLTPGEISSGNFPGWDFKINGKKIELKISSKGTSNSVIELGRADGRASGLSASDADYYMFLNAAGQNLGKLRIIPAYELNMYYSKDHGNTFETKTIGDKIGSILAPLNFRTFNDLMIAECDYNHTKQEFDTSTFKSNSYAVKMFNDYFK